MAKIRVCAIHCFLATDETLSTFTIPKERSTGAYEVKCMIGALNLETKEAYMYAEFERVNETLLRQALEASGANDITITALDFFSRAGVALKDVREMAQGPAFQLFERGTPSQYVQSSNSLQPIVDGRVSVDYVKKLEEVTNEADAAIDEKVPQPICLYYSNLTIIFTGRRDCLPPIQAGAQDPPLRRGAHRADRERAGAGRLEGRDEAQGTG